MHPVQAYDARAEGRTYEQIECVPFHPALTRWAACTPDGSNVLFSDFLGAFLITIHSMGRVPAGCKRESSGLHTHRHRGGGHHEARLLNVWHATTSGEGVFTLFPVPFPPSFRAPVALI